MKKIIILFIVFLFLLIPICACANEVNEKIVDCMKKMSAVQSYVEFYYMSTGNYPQSLKDLSYIFNSDVQKDSERIVFPNDPATGKPFVYKVSGDLRSYVLSVPDPSLYKVNKIEMRNVEWAWMNSVATQINVETKSELCGKYMTGIVQVSKKYQEEKKKLPSKIEDLIPNYIKAIPKCPLCGKDYSLKLTSSDLIIYCPSPKSHGCESFHYSLKKGMIVRPLEKKK